MVNCDQMSLPNIIQIHKLEFLSRLNKVEDVALKSVPVPIGNVFGRFFIIRSLDLHLLFFFCYLKLHEPFYHNNCTINE